MLVKFKGLCVENQGLYLIEGERELERKAEWQSVYRQVVDEGNVNQLRLRFPYPAGV